MTTQALAHGTHTAAPRETKMKTRSRRRWIPTALAVIAIIAAALVGWRATKLRAVPVARYQTAAIDRGPIAAKVTATGTLSALVTVSVGAQVSGRIATLGADFGSTVKTGQVIATIEPSLFRASVAQARANYAAAVANAEKSKATRTNTEKQFLRARNLRAENLLTGADYDAAEAAYGEATAAVAAAESAVSQAKAALDQAELNLRYTTIVSPIDGIVISRNVDVGQTVASALQTPTLFSIAQDLTRMQVDTNVAEADVGKIHAGMRVTFTVDAYPTRTFPGVVRQVRDNAQTIQNVVTYDAVIDVDNGERLLKPGMTASVTFVYSEKSDVLRISNAALRFKPDASARASMTSSTIPTPSRADERLVWMSRATTADPLLLKVGITDGVWTEVTDGNVAPGDLAVVELAAPKKAE